MRTMRIAAVLAGAVVLAQLVPYGRDHVNPAPSGEPRWDSPRTRALAARACFDCHSDETRWPWYSHVAPVSWLVQHDVDEGRSEVNFSEWNRRPRDGAKLAKEVLEGEMPPLQYPWARLTAAERAELARGLAATAGPRTEREARR